MTNRTNWITALCAFAFMSSAYGEGVAEAGAKVFTQCSACHTVGAGAQNGVGPVLNGVIGRTAGTYPGYRYSGAMRKSGLTWDETTLMQYLRGPDKLVPGTKMAFPGIASDKDLADLIAYLKQQPKQ
jgi:cytochrome c